MERKDIEIKGINTYELQEQFDENAREPLQELRGEIEEQYSGDGENIPDASPVTGAEETSTEKGA